MDLDSINSFANLLAVKGAGAATVLFILINLFVWYRTGSAHLLLKSLWGRLISGKSTEPKELHKFLDEYTGLLEFRFRMGLKRIRTIPHAISVIQWGEKHDEDLGDIAACRGYFDLEKICLRDPLPKAWVPLAQMLISFLLGLLALIFVALAVQDRAIVKLKDSHQWLLLGKKGVKPFFSKGFQFTQCQDNSVELSSAAGMPAYDIAMVCKELASSETKLSKIVDETVLDQRILFWYFSFIFIPFSVAVFNIGTALKKALAMRNRIRNRSTDEKMMKVEEDAPIPKIGQK